MNKEYTFVSIDPSISNTGLLSGSFTLSNISIDSPVNIITKKNKKADSVIEDWINRSHVLLSITLSIIRSNRPDYIFVEKPTGSKDYNSAYRLGVIAMYIAALREELRAWNGKLIVVSAKDAKEITGLGDQASKDDIMDWAIKLHPEFQWVKDGKGNFIKKYNEHLADAVAIAHFSINLVRKNMKT